MGYVADDKKMQGYGYTGLKVKSRLLNFQNFFSEHFSNPWICIKFYCIKSNIVNQKLDCPK